MRNYTDSLQLKLLHNDFKLQLLKDVRPEILNTDNLNLLLTWLQRDLLIENDPSTKGMTLRSFLSGVESLSKGNILNVPPSQHK